MHHKQALVYPDWTFCRWLSLPGVLKVARCIIKPTFCGQGFYCGSMHSVSVALCRDMGSGCEHFLLWQYRSLLYEDTLNMQWILCRSLCSIPSVLDQVCLCFVGNTLSVINPLKWATSWFYVELLQLEMRQLAIFVRGGFHSLDQICDCVVNSDCDCAIVSCASTDADINLEHLLSVHCDDVCGDTVWLSSAESALFVCAAIWWWSLQRDIWGGQWHWLYCGCQWWVWVDMYCVNWTGWLALWYVTHSMPVTMGCCGSTNYSPISPTHSPQLGMQTNHGFL